MKDKLVVKRNANKRHNNEVIMRPKQRQVTESRYLTRSIKVQYSMQQLLLISFLIITQNNCLASHESQEFLNSPLKSQRSGNPIQGPSQLFLPASNPSGRSIALSSSGDSDQHRTEEESELLLIKPSGIIYTTTNEPEITTSQTTISTTVDSEQAIAIATNRQLFLTHDQLSLSNVSSREVSNGADMSAKDVQQTGVSRSIPSRVSHLGTIFTGVSKLAINLVPQTELVQLLRFKPTNSRPRNTNHSTDILSYAIRGRQSPNIQTQHPSDSNNEPPNNNKQGISTPTSTEKTQTTSRLQCSGICRNSILISLPGACVEIPGQCGFMHRCCDPREDPFKGTPIEMSQPIDSEQTDSPVQILNPTSTPSATLSMNREIYETSTTSLQADSSRSAATESANSQYEEVHNEPGPNDDGRILPPEPATVYILSSANDSSSLEERGQTFDGSELVLANKPDFTTNKSVADQSGVSRSSGQVQPQPNPSTGPIKLETINGSIVVNNPQTKRPSYANWTDFAPANLHKFGLGVRVNSNTDRVIYRSNMDQSRRFIESTNNNRDSKQPSKTSADHGSQVDKVPRLQADSGEKSSELIETRGIIPNQSSTRASTPMVVTTSTTTSTTTTEKPQPTTLLPVTTEESNQDSPSHIGLAIDLIDSLINKVFAEAPKTTTLEPELDVTTTEMPSNEDGKQSHDVISRQSDHQTSTVEPSDGSIAGDCSGQCVVPLFANMCESRYKSHSCGHERDCCVQSSQPSEPTRHSETDIAPDCAGNCIPIHQSSLCLIPNVAQISSACPTNYLCCQSEPTDSAQQADRNQDGNASPSVIESGISSLMAAFLSPPPPPVGMSGQTTLGSGESVSQSARDGAALRQRVIIDSDGPQLNSRFHNTAKSSPSATGGSGFMSSIYNLFSKATSKPRQPAKVQQTQMVLAHVQPAMMPLLPDPSVYDQSSNPYQIRLISQNQQQQHQLAVQQQHLQRQQQQLQQQFQHQVPKAMPVPQPMAYQLRPQTILAANSNPVANAGAPTQLSSGVNYSPEFAHPLSLDLSTRQPNQNIGHNSLPKQASASDSMLTANSHPAANIYQTHQGSLTPQYDVAALNQPIQYHSLPNVNGHPASQIHAHPSVLIHSQNDVGRQHQYQQKHSQKPAISHEQRQQFVATPPRQPQQPAPQSSGFANGRFGNGPSTQLSNSAVYAQQQTQKVAFNRPTPAIQQVTPQQQIKPIITTTKFQQRQTIQEQRDPSKLIGPINVSDANNKERPNPSIQVNNNLDDRQPQQPARVQQNQASLKDDQAKDSSWRPQQIVKNRSQQQNHPDSKIATNGVVRVRQQTASGNGEPIELPENRPAYFDIQRKDNTNKHSQQHDVNDNNKRPAIVSPHRAPEQYSNSGSDGKNTNIWMPKVSQPSDSKPNRINYVPTSTTSTTTTTTTTTSPTTQVPTLSTQGPLNESSDASNASSDQATDDTSIDSDTLEEQMTAKASSIQTATDTRASDEISQDYAPDKYPSASVKPANKAQACGLVGGSRRTRAQSGRVMGGFEAKPGHWCWQAALMTHKNEYLCGGALIGPKWVLTAAHCVTQQLKYDNPLFVRLGQHNLNSSDSSPGARSIQVRTSYVHHNHNGISLDNDVALLRLNEPADLDDPSSSVCLVCLPERDSPSLESGKRCTVTGYGFETEDGPAALRVRQTDLPIVSDIECQAKTGKALEKAFSLPANSFCAGGELGRDACHGDGGSPLSCLIDGYYELAGIVSWGYKCGKADLPGVYSKVSAFVGWINQIVSANN